MDRDIIEGKWTEIKGQLREAYGDREQLEGTLQQKLGKSKDEVRQTVDRILNRV